MNMRMSRLMEPSLGNFEGRKRALQRHEMGQAYRKNAQYQSTKNPVLKALENILSENEGKERDKADQAVGEETLSGLKGIESEEDTIWEDGENNGEKPWHPAWMLGEPVRVVQGAGLPQKGEHFPPSGDQVEIPERFMGRIAERDTSEETMLSRQQSEGLAYERLFQLASMNYVTHMAMVKNDYRSFNEPTFSRTA